MASPYVGPYQSLITSEHNQKPNFMAVVGVVAGAMADCLTAAEALQPAFSLPTAQGAQLDILGLWIGISRIIPNVLVPGYFGFSELSTGLPDGLQLPFGELTDISIGGKWYEYGGTASGSTTLTDAEYLTILRAQITKNQSNGTLGAIENALQFIFGAPCSVADNGTLNLALSINASVAPIDQALLQSLDILPRPAGVIIGSITYMP